MIEKTDINLPWVRKKHVCIHFLLSRVDHAETCIRTNQWNGIFMVNWEGVRVDLPPLPILESMIVELLDKIDNNIAYYQQVRERAVAIREAYCDKNQ